MFRTILKVIYIGLSMFIGMIMYMGTYQSNGFNAIKNRANGYIETENYDELARMLGGIVNQNEVITIDKATKENQILLYEGTTLSSYNTYKANPDKKDTFDETEHIEFNNSYFLLVINPSFPSNNISGENLTNRSSIVFTTADENNSYEYKFIQNATVNKNDFVEHPENKEKAVLNTARDIISLEEAYGFYSIVIDKTLIDTVEAKLNTPITGFHLQDNEGKMVAGTSKEFSFSFTSQFYTDMKPLKDNYDTYLDAYQKNQKGDMSKGDFKKVSDDFNTFTEGFDKKMTEEYKDYAKGFEQKELIPTSVTWKTIGEMTIYALVVIMLYFLLFKFSQVVAMFSRLFAKITGKAPKTTKPAAKNNGKTTPMSAKPNINRETVVKRINDNKPEDGNNEDNLNDTASSNEEPEAVEAEVVSEDPLKEVVTEAPLEDADVCEEVKDQEEDK